MIYLPTFTINTNHINGSVNIPFPWIRNGKILGFFFKKKKRQGAAHDADHDVVTHQMPGRPPWIQKSGIQQKKSSESASASFSFRGMCFWVLEKTGRNVCWCHSYLVDGSKIRRKRTGWGWYFIPLYPLFTGFYRYQIGVVHIMVHSGNLT